MPEFSPSGGGGGTPSGDGGVFSDPQPITDAQSGYDSLSGNPVEIDGWEPVEVKTSKSDIEGKMDEHTDQCGHTEAQKNGSSNITYMCEGLIKKSKISKFYQIARSDEVDVSAEVLGEFSGTYKVQDASLNQKDVINTYEDPSNGTVETAFEFQLQFKEPETPKSVSGGDSTIGFEPQSGTGGGGTGGGGMLNQG